LLGVNSCNRTAGKTGYVLCEYGAENGGTRCDKCPLLDGECVDE